MPKETFVKCLALVFLVILIRVQNSFLKEHFVKMSAVELLLKLLFHVMVQHIEIQETTFNYKACYRKKIKLAYLIAYFYDRFI